MADLPAQRINDASLRFSWRHPENSLDCLTSVSVNRRLA
jgi:hypothetical protein